MESGKIIELVSFLMSCVGFGLTHVSSFAIDSLKNNTVKYIWKSQAALQFF